MKILAALLLSTSLAHAAQMEQCSYKTEYKGEVTDTNETPSLSNGKNTARFAEIVVQREKEGFRTFDIKCRALDTEKGEFHQFIQTRNGQVSLNHGLTEDACYYSLYRLREASIPAQCDGGCFRLVQPTDLERGECFK